METYSEYLVSQESNCVCCEQRIFHGEDCSEAFEGYVCDTCVDEMIKYGEFEDLDKLGVSYEV